MAPQKDMREAMESKTYPIQMLACLRRSAQFRYDANRLYSRVFWLILAQDRKLLWKLDLKLIPWLSFLYLISFLDRTNIGNAKIDGLQEDLKMTDGQYNASLSIFFVSYALFEPLTNILLKRLRPSVFLPIIMLWCKCCSKNEAK
jgi:hypothetical protein